MAKLIKRYENRKLYDTEAKVYVSLEQLAQMIANGEQIQVVDNATGADITVETLAKIIADQPRGNSSKLPAQVLHDFIRWGGRMVNTGVGEAERQIDKVLTASLQKLGPVREVSEEVSRLKARVAQMEETLARMQSKGDKRS